MDLKAPMSSKFCAIICFIILIGCRKEENFKSNNVKIIFEKVDVSQVPNIIINVSDTTLKLVNGVYYMGNKPFSGYVKENYDNGTIKNIGSYLNGKQQGITKTFYSNGNKRTERNYKNGKAYGKHIGYWEDGKREFEFQYFNDKREGLQKQWYTSGKPYAFLTFKNDVEEGMQQAWRETGKPYINYEVKNGKRYGLQKAGLCYTLKEGQLK